MAQHLDKGTFGEQGAGFFFGARGYFFVDGPSGTGGHAANAHGFDGVAYNAKTDHLIIYDNKTFASSGNVGKATAIDPAANLGTNLNDMIHRVRNMAELPARDRILDLLTKTQASLTKTGVKAPSNVQIAVTNFGGNSKNITKSLCDRGITAIEMNNAPAVPSGGSKTYINQKTIASMAQATRPISGADGYNMRVARVAALAELVRYAAQTLNDWSLKHALDRKLGELAPDIASALAYGNGALVVIHINAASPPGNVGMVVARSISSAFVLAHPGPGGRDAITAWLSTPKMFAERPPHVRLETQFIWIPPLTVH